MNDFHERKYFRFYKSYAEIYSKLKKNKQKLRFMEALLKIQWGEIDIKDVDFSDDFTLDLCWATIKHSVTTQIAGVKSKSGGNHAGQQGEQQTGNHAVHNIQSTIYNSTIGNSSNTPISQRPRVGEHKPKQFKNFMEMKEFLAANHSKYKKIEIDFENELWLIGRNGIPYNKKTVDDMPFEQRKLFWLHLINYTHLLGDRI